MAAQRCILVSPVGTSLMLCQLHTRCKGQFYDPQKQCCHDGALVPLGETRRCGSCSYRVCFEQCCPRWPLGLQQPLMVRLRGEDCSSPQSLGDRVCHSVI
ncbi:insulin growth factor-like family member 1 isoform X2 [Castor canadensis]|uniref:Insulin growth factor-like family member 1 isoform X2 n=1 Tax=Castor canadensis TaxID=51338 RepID=A0AC58L9K4_CASCN